MKTRVETIEGFTLVELLVTLSLLSIMAIYAFNAFGLTSKMKGIAQGVEVDTETQAVLRHFQEEISTLTPVYRQDATGASQLIFEGHETSLSYVITADGTRETGGLYRVTWQLNEKHQLTIERYLISSNNATLDAFVVLENIEDMSFNYEQSQHVWLDQKTLPRVVTLKITFDGKKSKAPETSALIVSGQ